MKLTFNTQNVNIQVALSALSLYRSGEFDQASYALQEILDVEPDNWDARLMLGACYYKTGQYFMADCAFRMILEHSSDPDIRKRAREGVLSTAGKWGHRVSNTPPEFGSCAVRQEFFVAWLDGAA